MHFSLLQSVISVHISKEERRNKRKKQQNHLEMKNAESFQIFHFIMHYICFFSSPLLLQIAAIRCCIQNSNGVFATTKSHGLEFDEVRQTFRVFFSCKTGININDTNNIQE